jgi:hypothetical protein
MILVVLLLSLCATSVWAAPFEVELERNVNLQLGAKAIPQRTLDDDITKCLVSFTRDQWKDPAAKLRIRIEHSLDGGLTWRGGACTAEGSQGTELLSICEVPFRPGTNRLVRGSYEVTGARFRATAVIACQ